MATVTKAANAHTVVATGWTNPGNAFASTGNNVYATAAPAKNATVNGDFGFATFTEFDSSATINSVTVTVEWKVSVTTVATLGVQLRNNGAAVGTETTFSSTTEAQSTQVAVSGISALDLLNGLVVARVRDARGNNNTAHTGSLDFVSLTVDYTANTVFGDSPAGTTTVTGSSSEGLGHAPSPSGSATITGSVTEAQTRSSSPSGSAVITGSLVEQYLPPGVTYTDSVTGSVVLTGSLSDLLAFDDQAAGGAVFAGSLVESYVVGDAGGRGKSGPLTGVF